MKKSSKVVATQARTARKVKEQRMDWTRVETVGIDLGDRFSYFCALDADGAIVAEGRVATTPGAIELRPHRGRGSLSKQGHTRPGSAACLRAWDMRCSWRTRASCG